MVAHTDAHMGAVHGRLLAPHGPAHGSGAWKIASPSWPKAKIKGHIEKYQKA